MAVDVDIAVQDRTQAAARSTTAARAQRLDLVLLAIGTVALTVVTYLFGLWGSSGHLAPPLDDTFIHLQYARQLAEGHPFQYNTGDPPSSGDSSFIYPFMLAPAFLVGLDGMKALLLAGAFNLVAHVAAVLLLYRLALGVAGRWVALFSAGLFLLDGRANWMFATGMETGLYTAALVAFFWAWWRGVPEGRVGLLVLIGSFAALLRTEGHIIVSLACVLTLLYLWRTRSLKPADALLLVPVLVGLVPYAVNLALTGYWQFNTALSKSHWYIPYSPLHEKLALTIGSLITVTKDIYLGFEIGRSPFPIFGLPVAILGAALALRDSAHRFLHLLLVTTFFAGLGLAHLLPPLHFYRYHQPYDFIALFYFAFAVVRIVEHFTTGHTQLTTHHSPLAPRSSLLATSAGVALLLMPQFVAFLFDFSNSTRDIYYQQMTFSEWIRRYTPKDARIAVSDTGAHKYLSDRYTIDVIGLTENAMRVAHFSGWGSVFDVLARMPEEKRPHYLLIHPNIALNEDESVTQGFLEPYYQITTPNHTITAGPTEMLYRINWDFIALDAEQTHLLPAGRMVLDQINVGDLEDEERHSYRIEARLPSRSEPKAIVTSASYEKGGPVLSESGRRHTGWEEFTLKSVPGKPLILGTRARLQSGVGQRLLVWANGKEVGLWEVKNERESLWQEYEYTIPADFITSDATIIRIDATFDPGGPGFATYRYWSFAP